MLTLDNVTTADGYTEDATLGPVPTAESIAIVVANASVMAQVAATDAAGTIQGWGPELLLTPQSTILTRAQGVRFRSAVAGTPAQVVAQLFEPRDPILTGGNAFTSTLSPGGGITPPGGSGAMELIRTELLAAPGANIDFTGIPSTYRHLFLLLQGRGTTAAAIVDLRYRFNNDAGANYDFLYTVTDGAAVSRAEAMGATAGYFGTICAATATAGFAGMCRVFIPNYSLATFNKQAESQTGSKAANVAGNSRNDSVESFWRSAAIVNRLTLFPSAGSFDTGTLASLYGITG